MCLSFSPTFPFPTYFLTAYWFAADDGADYNTMLQVPGTNTLLLIYANSRSKYSSEILGTYLDVTVKEN